MAKVQKPGTATVRTRIRTAIRTSLASGSKAQRMQRPVKPVISWQWINHWKTMENHEPLCWLTSDFQWLVG